MEMPTTEMKAPETPAAPPAGSVPETPAAPTGPSAAELQKQKDDLERQLKERDTQIADLNTTKATLETRFKQINEAPKVDANKDIQDRTKRILETAAYDPAAASAELANLLTESTTKASTEAVQKAQQAIQAQTFVNNIRTGVKSSNPDFDDDVVDVIMNKADEFARSGSYRTADEAVKAATDFVKVKFENFATKRNAVPPLPAGAQAEGGVNAAPVSGKAETMPSAVEEIQGRQAKLQKKIL